MGKKTIFETNQFLVRQLLMSNLNSFHEMQSNPLVMQYVTGITKPFSEYEKELANLIEKYESSKKDFYIYAIERKFDAVFVVAVALVKDPNNEDELGYRFLQKYWNLGYGFEICTGLIEKNSSRLCLGVSIEIVIPENLACGRQDRESK